MRVSRPLTALLVVGGLLVTAAALQSFAQNIDPPQAERPDPIEPREADAAPPVALPPILRQEAQRLLPPLDVPADRPHPVSPTTPLPPPPVAAPEAGEVLPPPPIDPDPPAPSPAPSPAARRAMQQLLQLREQLGSPFKGTSLEGKDEDDFARILQQAIERSLIERSLIEHQARTPDELPPLPLPPSMTPITKQLLDTASSLDQHAHRLEHQQLPARASRIRRLARRLRAEAQEIEELAIE